MMVLKYFYMTDVMDVRERREEREERGETRVDERDR